MLLFRHPVYKKLEWWGAGMVICLKQGADLHSAELMPLSLSFTFLVLAHPGSPGKKAVKRVCARANKWWWWWSSCQNNDCTVFQKYLVTNAENCVNCKEFNIRHWQITEHLQKFKPTRHLKTSILSSTYTSKMILRVCFDTTQRRRLDTSAISLISRVMNCQTTPTGLGCLNFSLTNSQDTWQAIQYQNAGEVCNVYKWACDDELRPTLIIVPSNLLTNLWTTNPRTSRVQCTKNRLTCENHIPSNTIFQEHELNSRFPEVISNSRRFAGFPGVVDTVWSVTQFRQDTSPVTSSTQVDQST